MYFFFTRQVYEINLEQNQIYIKHTELTDLDVDQEDGSPRPAVLGPKNCLYFILITLGIVYFFIVLMLLCFVRDL